MSGVKMRVPEIPLYVDTFTELGTNPTPLPWGDVYSALQTGVVQGVEGPSPAILSAGMHEVSTHIAPTRHIMTDLALLMNLDRFNSLTPEQQQVVREAGDQAFNHTFRELMREADQAAYNQIAADLTEAQALDVESFRAAVEPVIAAFLNTAPDHVQGWVSEIQSQ
jgi:TRAP-type C4-dicarboxylate transport system substrate-binding protein